ncbi:MAG: hypothetical protein KDK99_20805 [Verrucomicrobiales bacterium]|nr:hypothetical protein [Verrucomicrobiales bacterium]
MLTPPSAPDHIDLAHLGQPVYRGSVQYLYEAPGHPGFLVCQTTEAGSVFDVGSIFEIPGSDRGRAIFRHAMYHRLGQTETWADVRSRIQADSTLPDAWKAELLQGPLETFLERGASTHHIGMIDAETGRVIQQGLPEHPSAFNLVRRFPVMTPPQRPLMGGFVFDYAQFHQSDTYVIPLEYIVRFGVTSGSSILKKYDALSEAARRSYEQELGLCGPMVPWSMLQPPIFDLTSKYEPEDRNVSRQEALLMSGLSGQAFADTVKMALLGAWAVRAALAPIGLDLWDLKWEFALDRDTLLFVDTIDSDSFRATRTLDTPSGRLIIHFNKQAMRDYYRILHPEWYAGVNIAKAEAKRSGGPFKQILTAGQRDGIYPPTPQVEPEFLAIQGRKTDLIRQHISGTAQGENASDIARALEACGRDEIGFYQHHDRLDALVKVNGI